MDKKTAIIIGAGPAGLTAAYELVHKSEITPIVFEKGNDVGGLAKTVNYKGNRIDIGGHRFFSKSDRVMQWWSNILPLQGHLAAADLIPTITYHNQSRPVELNPNGPNPEVTDRVMLIRNRLSRIFFLRKFFDYPISLNLTTIKNLGMVRVARIGASYLHARLFPIKEITSLEDFFIDRFGRELYLTFFKEYTEKVWGVPCDRIKAEWGAQRIKGLSVTKTLWHAIKTSFAKDASISQKNTETSLIERFLYPKYGPGQMWEEVARIVESKGGQIHLNKEIVGLNYDGVEIKEIVVREANTGLLETHAGDYFLSTMPVKELIDNIDGPVPETVKEVARGLMYRDFITVGLLLRQMKIGTTESVIIPDNWIYVQEPEVRIGRIQIFNNWSPYLVQDKKSVWIGCEFFCNEGDGLWNKPDEEIIELAVSELDQMGLADRVDVRDGTLIRVKNTYPAYFGSYDSFHIIRDFTDKIENLFLVGRNGMHRYNNQDHSMLTAMAAVENIIEGIKTKENIWSVNVEGQYIEEKITSVENLTEGFLKRTEHDQFQFNPDVYWERTEASYQAYPTVRHRKRFVISSLKRYAASSERLTVFDYGMGEGDLLVAVKQVFRLADDQLAGCDVSSRAVEVARGKINSPHLYDSPFPKMDRKFKVIVCSEVIEHTKDYLQILFWLKNHLEPQGLLILTTQSGKVHPCDTYAGHTQHFKRGDLVKILKRFQFSIERARLWGFPFFTLQKYLTEIDFERIKESYLEGDVSFRRRLVFNIAYCLFFIHDLIRIGPQIYVIARSNEKLSN